MQTHWFSLTRPHRASPQTPPNAAPNSRLKVIQRARFHKDWLQVRSTPALSKLFTHYGLDRLQALRQAPPAYAQEVDTASGQLLISAAARVPLALTLSLGPASSHHGDVHDIRLTDSRLTASPANPPVGWREDQVAHAWVVHHPTAHGLSSHLELFDAQAHRIVALSAPINPVFIATSPSHPRWQQLLIDLQNETHCAMAC